MSEHVPPAISVLEEGPLIVDEFDGRLGLFLFLMQRTVEIWAGVKPRSRPGLFAEGSYRESLAQLAALEVEPETRAALAVIVEVTGQPARGDPYDVSAACRVVGRWAAGRECYETARLFAQAAAMCVPDDARILLEAGRYAIQGRNDAERDRLLSLGLQISRNKEADCRILTTLAAVDRGKGRLRRAQRNAARAYRIAKGRKLVRPRAEAAHELFLVNLEIGYTRRAAKWARRALRMYGADSPRVPLLVPGLARHWMERGRFRGPLRALRAALPLVSERGARLAALSLAAWAAAARGGADVFDAGAREVEALVGAVPVRVENAARALLDLARGAAHLGRWEAAEETARRAWEVARERGEARVRWEAGAVRAAAARRELARVPPETFDPVADARLWKLLRRLVRRVAPPAEAGDG